MFRMFKSRKEKGARFYATLAIIAGLLGLIASVFLMLQGFFMETELPLATRVVAGLAFILLSGAMFIGGLEDLPND